MSPYELAYNYVLRTNRCIFLTGKAGTGKTTLLRRLCIECPKQTMVVAPTGVAAINADGMTIHSLFQLPPQLFLPTPQERRRLFAEMQLRQSKLRLLRNMELLVIDEVSMVRADLLDTIDAVLRSVRRRQSLPFGGVQVLFIGDLYQLSPVAREQEWTLLRDYYEGPYFFQSHVFREIQPVYIELDHVYRQQDMTFVSLLNEVRNNCLSPRSLALLNSRCMPDWKQNPDEPFYITLSTHNRQVDALNGAEFARLEGDCVEYGAQIEGTFPEAMYPMDATLRLKKGARVMFVRNDSAPEKLYYNGKLGIVLECTGDRIVVEDEQGRKIEVHRETWENVRYVSAPGSDEVQTEVAGTFTHIPLRLAWAVTIHKAQGLTFEHVVIDAAEAFAAGQVYVALSRCRSLEGIVLLRPIPDVALANAREVLQFTASQPDRETIEERLPDSQRDYLLQMLMGLYDFRDQIAALEMVQRGVEGSGSFNTDETRGYLKTLLDALQDEQRVAETFQRQIRGMVNRGEYGNLCGRVGAAHGYFKEKIAALCERLKASPAYTDDAHDGKEYEERMTELCVDLMRKERVMRGVAETDGAGDVVNGMLAAVFEARRRFVIPKVRISAKVEKRGKKIEMAGTDPGLLRALVALRKEIAKDLGVADRLYMVVATKTIVEICRCMPRTKKEMLAVKGMGAKKYALYGERALEIVNDYIANHCPGSALV